LAHKGVNRWLWAPGTRVVGARRWRGGRQRWLLCSCFSGRFPRGLGLRTSRGAGGRSRVSISRSAIPSPWPWWPGGSFAWPSGATRDAGRSSGTSRESVFRSFSTTKSTRATATGLDAGISLSCSYNGARRHLYDYTPSEGRGLGASLSFAHPSSASQLRLPGLPDPGPSERSSLHL
jgi:hypothetical protein